MTVELLPPSKRSPIRFKVGPWTYLCSPHAAARMSTRGVGPEDIVDALAGKDPADHRGFRRDARGVSEARLRARARDLVVVAKGWAHGWRIVTVYREEN